MNDITEQPILHIGYHKTATTWFQQAFYPEVRGAAFAKRRNVRQAFLCTNALAFDQDEALKALDLPAGKRPIICEEALVGYYENGGFLGTLSKDIAYRIQAVYPQARIVIFLRNQLDMLVATYLQYIRRGGTESLQKFLWPYYYQRRYRTKPHKKPMFCLEHFAYHRLIFLYRQLFGDTNVHVFLYEDFKAAPRDFLRRYCHELSLDIDIDTLSFAATNVTYGTGTYRLARALNHVTVGDAVNTTTLLPLMPRKVNETLMNSLNRTPLAGRKVTPARLFNPRLMDLLTHRFADSNAVLADELGLDLNAYGYPISDPAESGGQPASHGTYPATPRNAASASAARSPADVSGS